MKILAVTPDEMSRLGEIAKTHEFSFPLLHDARGETIKAWGILNEDKPPLPIPTTLLVGKGGVVTYLRQDPGVVTRPLSAELLEALAKLEMK